MVLMVETHGADGGQSESRMPPYRISWESWIDGSDGFGAVDTAKAICLLLHADAVAADADTDATD